METLYDIFEENKDCNKFVVWKRYQCNDGSYEIEVVPTYEDDINWKKAPSKKINWFKVIFNKKYRCAIKYCFDYAMYHADTFRGENAFKVVLASSRTKIPYRRNYSVKYDLSISK